MGVIDTIKLIKQTQVGNLVLIKIGKFMYSYGKDAYIMSYLFKYKIKLLEGNIYVCSFPKEKLNKIMANLENEKINYMALDRKNSYRVDEQSDNKNLNKYDECFEKAIKYVKRKNQIDYIYNALLEKIESDEVEEEIILLMSIRKCRNSICPLAF